MTGRTDGELKHVVELGRMLTDGGSVWEVSMVDDEFALTRRDLGLAKEAITATASQSQQAHDFLVAAWNAIAVRHPNANEAYDKAVKAVEAAAQPIVSPKHAKATLGTIIGDIKAKPTKWTITFGSIDTVIGMCQAIWTNHLRHGTDPRPRTDHTVEEADEALYLAITLVRLFAGGHVRAGSGGP
jgi:hypothetical protein